MFWAACCSIPEAAAFFHRQIFFASVPPAIRDATSRARAGRFSVGENFSDLAGLAQIAAQDGVDEAGLVAVAGAFGQLDCFVDGGMRRYAVKPENLVESKPQKILERGSRLAAGRGFAGDETVQRGLPADHATNEFVAQAAVGGWKPRAGERGFKQILRKFVAVQPL